MQLSYPQEINQMKRLFNFLYTKHAMLQKDPIRNDDIAIGVLHLALLIYPQRPSTSTLRRRLLLFVSLIECSYACMVTSNIVEIFDLEDSNDPVLAGECFLDGVELWTLGGELGPSDSILSLSWWEERTVVVIRHFVPGGSLA
jgi:hypothetical protein